MAKPKVPTWQRLRPGLYLGRFLLVRAGGVQVFRHYRIERGAETGMWYVVALHGGRAGERPGFTCSTLKRGKAIAMYHARWGRWP